jgi:hypothetical protein
MHVKLVDYAPWVLVVGEAAFNVAIVAERLGLRLSAATQPDWCIGGDGNSERVDNRDGAIEQIGAVADYDDPRGSGAGLEPFLNGTFVGHVLVCSSSFNALEKRA